MPQFITCTNKGCYKTTNESKLNKDAMKVFCAECKKEVTGISDFIKQSMISIGQVERSTPGKDGYECPSCKKISPATLKKDTFVCKFCGSNLKLSPIFERALKTNFGRKNE